MRSAASTVWARLSRSPAQLTQPVADVYERQRVQEWPSASPTAVRHEVNFDKARHRLVPVGEGFDRDLMLEQCAGLRRADAAFGQTSSRGCERSIDG